ncbi:type I-E CRISPR-associated protein Cse1/CasA [Ligilactobacillus saerimneri]|uniref:type I-E CRISPR-associated protein Cse1/CasA n=1 Tax=Ligilactobacillus saerimneri TaxID=228229 RepID=UPI003F29632F
MKKSFNLVSEPWIRVLETTTNEETMVSLKELFANAQNYRQLAGDTRSQDLAILRFLLAILTTVYSRVDGNDQPYDGLELDNNFRVVDTEDFCEDFSEEDALETWHTLFAKGIFTPAVAHYLDIVADKFDFFGDQPFYQVTRENYNKLVEHKKAVNETSIKKRTGTVAVKQINRLISESNNSAAVFATKSKLSKNRLTLDELVRWIITYQSFTGVTDKTKTISKEKFSISPGWVYKLNPVYVVGDNLFETLLYNLVLFEDYELWSPIQKPVWEFENIEAYVSEIQKANVPDNIAQLYTIWSRILHIEWVDDEPIIFSAGLPMPNAINARIEPMTTWKRVDKKTNDIRPATRNLGQLGQAMWRNFGQYIRTTGSVNSPEIVNWLEGVTNGNHDKLITLATAVLISDGNATSQSPAAEFTDDFALNREVIFDKEMIKRWPERIENVIEVTQSVGKNYWILARQIADIRDLADGAEFANHIQARFYERLTVPFKEWLASLRVNDDRDLKQREWKRKLQQIVYISLAEDIESVATPRDFRGTPMQDNDKQEPVNIFTAIASFRMRLAKCFKEDE